MEDGPHEKGPPGLLWNHVSSMYVLRHALDVPFRNPATTLKIDCTVEQTYSQWWQSLPTTLPHDLLKKTFQVVGYTIQYDCVAYCVVEHIDGIVMNSRPSVDSTIQNSNIKIFTNLQRLLINIFTTSKKVTLWLQKAQVIQNQIFVKEWLLWKETKSSAIIHQVSFKAIAGASLVVQWLRIHLSMQATWVWSLIRELRSHLP